MFFLLKIRKFFFIEVSEILCKQSDKLRK